MQTEKVKLICLPHAGSYVDGYARLKLFLDDHIEQILIEYPGHGRKHREPLIPTLEGLAEVIYEEIKPHLYSKYAFYGHSMGGRMSWLVSRKLQELNQRLPVSLFISGCPAPSAPFMTPDDINFRTVSNLTGPGMEELREMFYPIIENDIKAVDDYQYEKREPLPIPITVLYGMDDTFPAEDFRKWEMETASNFAIHKFPGDHFFNFKYFNQIGRIINQGLGCL
ncbi:MAG: thioesterase domain-containing protein [Candidatus Electryoneaceae bacterium]|nr:thioesterase domain-containing protein [Candidatus Electryoneaceae bacterium]